MFDLPGNTCSDQFYKITIGHDLHVNSVWSFDPFIWRALALAQSGGESDNPQMTEKEIVLETIRALPDDCSLEEIAERIKFMAAVQKGLDQLDKGTGIPHDEVKKQLASWLTG